MRFLLLSVLASLLLQSCGSGDSKPVGDVLPKEKDLNQCLQPEAEQIGIIGGKVLGDSHQLARSVANLLIIMKVNGSENTTRETSCTASFLDQNILLTAAHCVSVQEFAQNNSVDPAKVERRVFVLMSSQPYCGFTRKIEDKTLEIALVEEVLIKSEFEKVIIDVGLDSEQKIEQPDHDLALLKINNTKNNLKYRTPIKLAKSESVQNKSKHFLLGYGETMAHPSEGGASDGLMPALRFTPIELINDSNFADVKNDLKTRGKTESSQFLNELLTKSISGRKIFYAFTDSKKARGACAGDSGGPSIILNNGRALQTGVASFVSSFGIDERESCKTSAFYVNAHAHEEWLKASFRKLNSQGAVKSENLFE